MRWNSKIKDHYVSLGYIFTKMRDEFLVKVEDLTKRSFQKVLVSCDYCKTDFYVTWSHRTKSFEDSPIKKDSCMKCKYLKAQESLLLQYGVSNLMQVEEYFKKQRKSCFDHYGYENPFQAEEIKEKIINTNLLRYGVKNYTQTKEYILKSQKTNLEKYGYTNHTLDPVRKNMFRGSNSPVWKGGIHDIRWDRLQPIYKKWRFEVFKRDNFICQKCHESSKYIEAHHIFNFNTNKELQYEISNGITLCKECHKNFHLIYKKKNNNLEQIEEFLQKR